MEFETYVKHMYDILFDSVLYYLELNIESAIRNSIVAFCGGVHIVSNSRDLLVKVCTGRIRMEIRACCVEKKCKARIRMRKIGGREWKYVKLMLLAGTARLLDSLVEGRRCVHVDEIYLITLGMQFLLFIYSEVHEKRSAL